MRGNLNDVRIGASANGGSKGSDVEHDCRIDCEWSVIVRNEE